MWIKILKLASGMIMGYDRESVKAIDALPKGVFEVELLTGVVKAPRPSVMQYRYYWGVVLSECVRAVDDSYTAEQFHNMFKGLYFGYTPLGNSYVIGGSTKQLNTSEMENYLKACRDWAFEQLNCVIQLPNEAGFEY